MAAQKGENTYEFLQLPNSARIAGIGGVNVSLTDEDLSFSYHNPALLSDTLDNFLTLNYVNYLTDLNYGYVAYAKDFGKFGTFSAGMFYLDYGSFDHTDVNGNVLGDFTAKEFALNLMWSYQLNDYFRVGANLKPVYSVMETYKSFGLALDLGAQFESINKLTTVGVAFKNMGGQLKRYTPHNPEKMPFEIMLGVSQRLAHAPFRVSATYRHLQQFKLGYDEPSTNFGGTEMESPNFGQVLLRHFVFGLEFIPSEHFYLMGGINAQRRAEMAIDGKGGLVGFTWGAGVKVLKFNISYGSAHYHLAGRTNFFSISTSLNRFM